MKIIQLIQKQQLRGAEIFASQLGEWLVKAGHDVMLVSLFEGEAALPFSGTKVSLSAPAGSRLLDIRSWRRLNEIISTFKPDIIQANAGDTLKYAVLSKVLFGWNAKLVFRNANMMSAFMRGPLHRSFNVWLLKHCDSFISVSENCRQDLVKLYPGAVRSSVTIPIGTEMFDDVPAISREVPAEEPVFIGIGSFVPEKNHLFLIEVFHHCFRANAKGFLWLVGDGRLRPRLEAKVSSLGITERVRFWGYRSDVISILKAADIFIMPSLIEGLPAVILEAIACSVPVVASDVGGIPEVVKNDVTGVCIAGWSAEFYAEKISKLLNDKAFRDDIVKRAKEHLIKKYSIQTVSSDFALHYRKLLG